MSSRNLIAVALLALALLVGGGAMVVHAVPGHAAGEGNEMGVVDMERLYNSSDLPQVLAQKAAQIGAQAQERLDALSDAKFLDAKELQEYGDLIAKVQPEAAQVARAKELKALSQSRADELSKLQIKQADMLTAKDRMRMQSLVEMSHLIDKVLPSVQNDLAQDQTERLRAIRRDQIAQLRTLVATVAKEKGIAHVFDVNAMVYSSTDLTPFVLKKLKPGK